MPSLFARILPFFFLGFMLVLFILGIVVLSYLWVLAALVGLIILLIAKLKSRFSPRPPQVDIRFTMQPKPPNSGRIIEHDDNP